MKKLKKILSIKWFKIVLSFIHFFIILHSVITIIWVFLTILQIKGNEFFKDFIPLNFQSVFFNIYLWLLIIYFLITGIKLIIKVYYFNKVFRKHQMQVANCEYPQHQQYKFSDAFKAIKKSFKMWWDA
ncbi:hypothetical protein [Spiroplasma endosymbiont of 'Nebria riversi']|uniref:hypothetical protein n=1 Tax=Spiroplasma endosymbiont of 'Nebria riversi' TaxID=2792084 RepID=UPI001C051AC0|nr:hypothetical protein [Spiroplasma endosymbiont of 'Nebria riversi']